MKKVMNLAVAAVTGLCSAQGFAAGFEKNTMWSGRYMGRAGAAVSSVDGPEALYFNPARLMNQQAPMALSVNVSPTYSQYQAPAIVSTTSSSPSVDSEKKWSTPLSILYSYKLSEKFALGAGFYTAGGSQVEYKNVKVSPFPNAYAGSVKTDLMINEFSVGGAYQIIDGLTVGLAYRVSMVNAAFNMLQTSTGDSTGTSSVQSNFSNLKSTEFTGFRLGVAYAPSTDWGLGLSYRSKVDFNVKGDSSQQAFSNGTGLAVPGAYKSGSATVTSTLPQQLNFGGHLKFSDMWTGFLEYSWTNYSTIKSLGVSATGLAGAIPNVKTDWADQHVYRIAAEYVGFVVPIRFGYSFNSQVTPDSTAKPALATPGTAHTFAVGSSYEVSEALRFDGALEYTQASGTVESGTAGGGAAGKYTAKAIPAIHLGGTFFF